MPTLTRVGLWSTSDVITFDQNDSQIRVIRLIKPEICRKMLRFVVENSEKNSLGYSVFRISRLDDALSGILILEGSPVEG